MNRRINPTNKAFTFIELLVVLLIVSLMYTGAFAELGQYVWVLEILLSIFWSVVLFFLLRRVIWDCTTRITVLWNVKPAIVSLFVLHVALSLFLRFYYGQSLFFVFPTTFLAGVLLPIALFPIAVNLHQKFKKTARISALEMTRIAKNSLKAQEFLRQFQNPTVYIYGNSREALIGTCLLHYRRSRDEREEMYEDLLLEIPIDLKRKEPVEDLVRLSHYLFQPYQDGSIVMELPQSKLDSINVLDDEILFKFDRTLNSFPSLERLPLPLAIRRIPYETFAATD